MAYIEIPPEYFTAAAELYKQNQGNRKIWLKGQIELTEKSLLQYQQEIVNLYKEAEKLGAVFNTSGQLTSVLGGKSGAIVAGIGGVLATIPTGATQIIGGVLIISSVFFSKAENKLKNKKVQEVLEKANERISEAEKVGEFHEEYKKELALRNIIPILLTLIIIWLIIS